MLVYVKEKSSQEELYETDFLSKLKEKNTKFSKISYWLCFFFYELIAKIKYLYNIITVKQIYNAYIFILPFNLKSRSKRKLKKCMRKVRKLISKYKIDNIVFSKELEKRLHIFEEDVPKKLHLLDGSGVMPYLIKEILEYIAIKQNKKIELEDLYLCMNEPKQIYLDNISYLSHYFRNIHIITPYINKFEKVTQKIEEKENIVVTISNNKKKSMKKAKWIINFDFSKDEIKQYSIYRKAIIITMEQDKDYDNIGFEGIQIKKVEIDTSDKTKAFFAQYNLLENVPLTILYESILNSKQQFYKVKNKIREDEVKVIRLYGKSGEIAEEEYRMNDSQVDHIV